MTSSASKSQKASIDFCTITAYCRIKAFNASTAYCASIACNVDTACSAIIASDLSAASNTSPDTMQAQPTVQDYSC